ncbi:hypothetical protein [uncultured Porticoccus sp.]|uniref:hypothetical protein n=1 Tax=uncultured Porticoccus sp. TaxID=1256050 RepID=UPI0030DC2238|tara:strand:+ start:2265 stop:2747 length:483 start_codon:yes stop_codon:yes gene_type:complete
MAEDEKTSVMSVNATLPQLRMPEVRNDESYLYSATDFYNGAKELIDADGNLRSSVLLIAQSTENVLKAFLACKGVTIGTLSTEYNHNLIKMWEDSAKLGLPIDANPPAWCEKLDTLLQKGEFFLRYPIKLHGTSYPNVQSAISGLESLMTAVAKETEKSP